MSLYSTFSSKPGISAIAASDNNMDMFFSDVVKNNGIVFSTIKDMTDLYPMATSSIISKASTKLLKDLCNDKTDAFASILITKDGKCLNEDIKKQLRLF